MFGNNFVGGGSSGGGGSFEIIADVSLSANSPSINFSGIPSTYKHLKIMYSLRSDRALGSDRLKIVCNNDTGANKYESILYYWYHPSTWGTISSGITTFAEGTFFCGDTALADSFGGGFIDFPDYASIQKLKLFQVRGGQMQTTAIKPEIYDGMAVWRDKTAIQQITLYPEFGANFKIYSRATLYGIN